MIVDPDEMTAREYWSGEQDLGEPARRKHNNPRYHHLSDSRTSHLILFGFCCDGVPGVKFW